MRAHTLVFPSPFSALNAAAGGCEPLRRRSAEPASRKYDGIMQIEFLIVNIAYLLLPTVDFDTSCFLFILLASGGRSTLPRICMPDKRCYSIAPMLLAVECTAGRLIGAFNYSRKEAIRLYVNECSDRRWEACESFLIPFEPSSACG